ncbi:MAG: hypothetical protein ACI9TH_000818 [Kiritimatiellia bacterium]
MDIEMNNRVIKLMVLAGLMAGLGFAEPVKTEQSLKDWTLLFDGKTLNGWNSWKTKGALEPGAWKVDGGELVMSGKNGGDVYTAEGYENYEMVIEWKTTGNSGILFRVDPSHKGAIWNKAPEMQVDKGDPHAKGSTSAGGFYALYDFTGEKVFYPDDWNHVRVRCMDDHFTIWFNHKQAHDFTVGSDDWNARVGKSKFSKFEGFGTLKKGHIGLQDHGHSVRFRNIKIRSL